MCRCVPSKPVLYDRRGGRDPSSYLLPESAHAPGSSAPTTRTEAGVAPLLPCRRRGRRREGRRQRFTVRRVRVPGDDAGIAWTPTMRSDHLPRLLRRPRPMCRSYVRDKYLAHLGSRPPRVSPQRVALLPQTKRTLTHRRSNYNRHHPAAAKHEKLYGEETYMKK